MLFRSAGGEVEGPIEKSGAAVATATARPLWAQARAVGSHRRSFRRVPDQAGRVKRVEK